MSADIISLKDTKSELSGVTQIVKELKQGFQEVVKPLNEIRDTLKTAFPTDNIEEANQALTKNKDLWKNVHAVIASVLDVVNFAFQGQFSGIFDVVAIQLTLSLWWSAFVIETIKQHWDSLSEYLSERMTEISSSLSEAWKEIGETITGIWNDIMTTIETIWNTVGAPVMMWIDTTIRNIGNILDNLWNTVIGPIFNNVSETFSRVWETTLRPLFEKIGIALGKVGELFMILWNNFIYPFVQYIIDVFGPVFASIGNFLFNTFSGLFEGIGNVLNGIVEMFTGVIDFFSGIFTGDWKRALNGLINAAVGFGNTLISVFENAINGIINLINGMFSLIWSKTQALINIMLAGLENLLGWLGIDLDIQLKGDAPQIGKLSIPRIPTVTLQASGGFPATGQMFVAREAGPELVGTIGSRSAVVNNSQIVDSVSAGVYRAVREAMGSQNSGGVLQLIMDGTKVAEVVSDNVNAITRRTGRCPILA